MEIVKLPSVLWKAPKYKKKAPQKKQAPGVEWWSVWMKTTDLYFFRRKICFYFTVEYLRARRKPVEHRQPSRRLA